MRTRRTLLVAIVAGIAIVVNCYVQEFLLPVASGRAEANNDVNNGKAVVFRVPSNEPRGTDGVDVNWYVDPASGLTFEEWYGAMSKSELRRRYAYNSRVQQIVAIKQPIHGQLSTITPLTVHTLLNGDNCTNLLDGHARIQGKCIIVREQSSVSFGYRSGQMMSVFSPTDLQECEHPLFPGYTFIRVNRSELYVFSQVGQLVCRLALVPNTRP